MENKYKRGKIYLIRSDQSGLPPYYGSTTMTLSQRMGQHRAHMRQYDNGKHVSNCASFQLLQFPDVKIVLVEDSPCDRREQLLAREDFYIRSRECLNKINALRTVDDERERHRVYYEANADKERERNRAYNSKRTTCAVCGSEVRQGDIKRHQRTFKCKQSQPLFIPDGENTIDLSRDTTPLNV